jgi:adenine-specific DNA-methyltransferase
MESMGRPLRDWNININRGILTGLNEAFIIDDKKRKELISQDPKSDEVIRPILRGRDISRYGNHFAGWWIINLHNGIRERHIKPLKADDYPAIKNHLNQYYNELVNRTDKGDTPYNLRNCAYTDDFFKQKIVWGNLNLTASYTMAEPGMYISAPCTMIVGGGQYLLAILNSKLADHYIRSLGVTRNGGYFEYKPMFIEKLPVPEASESVQITFKELVDQLLVLKKEGENTAFLESEIDKLVFNLYHLNEEEIRFIEGIHK